MTTENNDFHLLCTLSPRWICFCSPQQISGLDSRDWLLWVIVPGTTSNIIYPTKSVKRTATTDKIRHPLNAPLDSTLPKSLLLSLYSPLDSIIQYSAPHMSSPNFRWVNVGHDGVASGGRKVPNRELLFCHRCTQKREWLPHSDLLLQAPVVLILNSKAI